VLVAEIIGVSPDLCQPDRGDRQGQQLTASRQGQAVIDAYGLFGQIIEVSRFSSARAARHRCHACVAGAGGAQRCAGDRRGRWVVSMSLDVNHVASTMDVRPGDLLVSSGLGQRFPGGYPVGVVESVTNDPGKPFAVVVARPSAQLDRSRHVLVVTEGASADAASSGVAPSGAAQEAVGRRYAGGD
jgi:rod shape-determining protein MreC